MTFCKLSIVCQYRRIFTTPCVTKLCAVVIGFLVVYGFWTVLGSALMCVPVQYFWGVGSGHCMNKTAFWFSNAALNIVTDVFIYAVPIPLIRRLQIAKKQKIALIFLFALGAL